jgi:hypothetical protein
MRQRIIKMTLKGQQITKCQTLKSMYDGNCVAVTDDKGNSYRLSADVILQMVNGFNFKKNKKKVHTYLEINED